MSPGDRRTWSRNPPTPRSDPNAMPILPLLSLLSCLVPTAARPATPDRSPEELLREFQTIEGETRGRKSFFERVVDYFN